MALSDRFDRAFLLAHRIHRDQRRKGTPIPYIAHVLAVASVTLEYGGTEDQAIGALLHDTLEDTTITPPAELRGIIRADFGDAVLLIVEDCTDTDVQPKPPWRERKERYLAHAREKAHPDSLLVSAADKLHNLHAIIRDYRHEGEALWERFNPEAGKEGVLWYHRALAEIFRDRLGGKLAADLDLAVKELERVTSMSRDHPSIRIRPRALSN